MINVLFQKKGFTLAEILITIVIIGVISALTIPLLIQKTKEKETIAALHKAYSGLQKALYSVQAKEGEMSVWEIPDAGQSERAEALAKYIIPKMNVTKVCGTGTGCFPDTTYKYLNGENWTDIDSRTDLYKFVLADGMSVAIKLYETSSANSQGFFVDVNGFKPPNTRGKDEFVFLLDTKTNLLSPYGKKKDEDTIKSDCSKTGKGNYCAAYVFKYNKMDYLE